MSENKLTMEFARRDDCLDSMVPSDLRLLISERDRLRDQLVDIESQVLWRTEDMQKDAIAWTKSTEGECLWIIFSWVWAEDWGRHFATGGSYNKAHDYRPDEEGPILLPIINTEENIK